MDPLTRRCANIHAHHKRRAKLDRQFIYYSREQLQALVQEGLGRGLCPYCKLPLLVSNFNVDHWKPTGRGGDYSLTNLDVICEACNQLKGLLTGEEFERLLQFLGTIHPIASNDVLRRLRSGGATAYARR